MTDVRLKEPRSGRLTCRRNHLHCGIIAVLTASMLPAVSGAVGAPPALNELGHAIAPDLEAIDAGARMTHQAEALLLQLSVDGADIAVLFGVPTREQADRVFVVATEARERIQQAHELLQRAVQRLGADPAFADRRDLQDQRSSYEVEYLLTRLPLAHARSAVLLSMLATSTAESARLANDARKAIDIIESDGAMLRARRFSITAATMQALGDPIDAAFIERIIEFVNSDVFTEISLQHTQIRRELPAATVSLLWQLRQYEQAKRLAIRHFSSDQADALTGVVRRDSLARIELARAERTTSRTDRERALIDAINAIADENVVISSGLLQIALSKIERILPAEKMNLNLPIAGRIASGRRLLKQGNASGAIGPLQSAWDELDASNPTLMQACGWPLAKALRVRASSVSDMARAGRTLLMLANIAESESASSSALQSAVDLLQWSLDNTDDSVDQATRRSINAALRTGLDRALAQWPSSPSADRWRMRLSGLTGPTQRRELLQAITPQSELFARARLALAWIVFEELSRTRSAAQREAVAFTMLQYIQQARRATESMPNDTVQSSVVHQASAVALVELGRFDRAVAEALKWDDAGGVGSPDAVDYVRQILSRALNDALFIEDSLQASTLAQSIAVVSKRALMRAWDGRGSRSVADHAVLDLARSLLLVDPNNDHSVVIQSWADRFDMSRGVGVAQAMTLAAIGEDERAFALYRQIVEASRTLDVSDEFFWRAWVEMLTILGHRNAADDRDETILRHIAQLRAQDSQLGGRLMRRQFESLERAARTAREP